jgi:hypothetical protein
MSPSRSRRRRRRLLRRLALSAGVILLLAAASGAWLLYRADQVRTHLEAVMVLLPTLQEQLSAGDGAAAQATLQQLQEHTAQARTAGTDPLWKTASFLPVVGVNFFAVTEVTASADDVTSRAIAPLADKFAALDWDSLAPRDGQVQLAPIEDAAPTLISAANTVSLSHSRLASIDSSRLLPQVAGPLAEATAALAQADTVLGNAASAARLLPGMLGAEGPRNYLVLIQNNAELRATGGIPGAFAVISADNGTIELTGQGSAGDIGPFNPPLDVDPEQERIFSDRLGSYFQDVNLTPDFPTAAGTARTMWEKRHAGTRIDGVVALDPVVLGNILGATGPVELAGVPAAAGLPTSLTADNVVATLLSEVYARIRQPDLQDAYFEAVAQEVFTAVASGRGDGSRLVDALTASAGQGRIHVWSRSGEEQDILARTGLAGTAVRPAAGGAAFGLYFNDGTGAKMDYYVRRTAQLIRTCSANGFSEVTLREKVTNTAPKDAATSLSPYVTGNEAFGVPAGNVRTNHVAYGPAQSLLRAARIDGKDVPLGAFRHGSRPVGIVTTELAPGESATVEIGFSQVVQASEPSLDITPTSQDVQEIIQPTATEGSCP